ncbi:MAG: glycosyltransferase [Bacteroidales bacterium]|nr:glycosyltransferase [Bacteroidales bacterium]
MKRLLQINPVVRENTSTGKIMRELGELAQEAGWESFIAYSRARDGVPQHSSKLIPVGSKFDLLVHWLATRLFDAHGLASKRATRQLIRRIKEIDPDVVQIHNVHGYFLHYPLLLDFLAQRGKPVVWTVHDCWLFTGHCYHYAAAGCDRWQTHCHDCPQKHAFPASWLLDRSARNFEAKRRALTALPDFTLVTVSDWMRREVGKSFLQDVPCRVIHNGIDLHTFQPEPDADVRQRYGISTEHYVLAVASIWLPQKGLPDLVRLAGMLPADEGLVLVGRISEEQKAEFPAGVTFIPRTEDANTLAALYSGALALLNPTWQDNYPTVNLEAIACGTPVITYRTGGSVESITPETGFVVEQADVEGLVSAIRTIRTNGKEHYGEACRAFALQHFDRKTCFQEYIRLYESLATR